MNTKDTFKITASGDREIIMTREFNAPSKLVFDTLATEGSEVGGSSRRSAHPNSRPSDRVS